MLIAQTIAVTHARSQNLVGRWNVELTFANQDRRFLRFEAQGEGKGTFLLQDPKAKAWGEAKPSQATWTQAAADSVTVSGPMEFMLGNVGRDAGTLTFTGKFEGADAIAGEVEFSPLVGEAPSKHGTFKAVRASNG